MRISDHGFTYTWHERWAQLPDTPSARENGRTHGVAALPDGRVVVFRQADPAVVVLGPDGRVDQAWGERFAGAHGLTLTEHEGAPALWLTDQRTAEVVKVTLAGRDLARIAGPRSVPADQGKGKYVPTWVAENPESAEVWVADGYGTSLVRRYDKAGELIGTLDGSEGAGRFDCPHGIAVSPAGELWVADRGNQRVAVYDLDGRFLRHRDDVCHSPCGFAFHEGRAYVPELFGSVKVLGADLSPIAELGQNPQVISPDQWPGKAGWKRPQLEHWPNVAAEHIHPGRFIAPHGIAVAANGDIYVAEWIVAGRVTRLEAT